VNLHHDTRKKILYERRPPETWLAIYSLLMMFRVSTLSVHAGIAGERIVGTYFVSPDLTGAVYHSFP
jgi:hypothetical protein